MEENHEPENRPAEVFKIYLDFAESKVYMVNLATGEYIVPGGIDMSWVTKGYQSNHRQGNDMWS